MVAGGSGMAPILSLLRALAGDGSERPVRFFYGARTEEDLFYADLIGQLGAALADFEFVPGDRGSCTSRPCEFLEAGAMDDPEIYMCGPPPMIDAMIELATERHGDRRGAASSTTSSRPRADAVVGCRRAR